MHFTKDSFDGYNETVLHIVVVSDINVFQTSSTWYTFINTKQKKVRFEDATYNNNNTHT